MICPICFKNPLYFFTIEKQGSDEMQVVGIACQSSNPLIESECKFVAGSPLFNNLSEMYWSDVGHTRALIDLDNAYLADRWELSKKHTAEVERLAKVVIQELHSMKKGK